MECEDDRISGYQRLDPHRTEQAVEMDDIGGFSAKKIKELSAFRKTIEVTMWPIHAIGSGFQYSLCLF
jgi:hypothetical protein